ncbi:MAG: hypothetical protein M3480_01760 [Verrucomicrobiota bacterium]|nr:hypothetical protein [Verrucomicrobiota bacterium]
MRPQEQRGDAPPRQTPSSALIVDDAELIRRGIAAIISEEPDFSVCGSAGDELLRWSCWNVISWIFSCSISRSAIAMACNSLKKYQAASLTPGESLFLMRHTEATERVLSKWVQSNIRWRNVQRQCGCWLDQFATVRLGAAFSIAWREQFAVVCNGSASKVSNQP